MLILRTAIIFLTYLCISQTQAINSLNNYGDSAYPNRCVVDLGSSLVLLKFGESLQLDSLPCTSILCIGDGWGMLQTCDHELPPKDCHYSNFNRDEPFFECCKRRVICD